MTDAEQREAARQFYQKWAGRGNEDEDARSYWIDFLQNILGADHVTDRLDFEKKVIGPDGNTKRIDVYIPETRVLIEQKSFGIPLDKPQQGHNGMTPYEQAKMYDNSLPFDEKSRWIILSNFAEIWVYDLNEKKPEPKKFLLSDIQNKFTAFEILVNKEQKKISEEEELSFKAGKLVGLLYEAFLKESNDPESTETLQNLNMLCVRLVFCLYAEDAKLFGTSGKMFHDYLDHFDTEDMRMSLKNLFEILNTPMEERDEYDKSMLSQFPYVNGGLFADKIKIPPFTEEIRGILLDKASEGFDWSRIDATIFGALFESNINPETRRSGGMHFTSVENLHKVIDPLFLDELKEELKSILDIQVVNTKKKKLEEYQNKLASLRFMDPAAGSGNFLTLSYTELRRLENRALRAIFDCDKKQIDGQIKFLDALENPIKVSIEQFYGIEINDYAVAVAKTALWIAESQMMKETEALLSMNLDFLPLKTQAHIIEGNALRMDWDKVCPKHGLSYLLGNPPFVGTKWMNPPQKDDTRFVLGDIPKYGVLDYVACWYKKANDYISGTSIQAAFVSTNSITQGEQVAPLWKALTDISIDFAYRTFIWNSEAYDKASVHCVIIGFSCNKTKGKLLFDGDQVKTVDNINGYLQAAENVIIEARKTPLCDGAPMISKGSQPTDGGNLILSAEEKEQFENKYPDLSPYIRRYMGAVDFLNNEFRYCFWLKDCPPKIMKTSPELMARLERVRKSRLNSPKKATNKWADKPALFTEDRQPNKNYILLPVVSSERRRYMPIGWVDWSVIANTNAQTIAGGTLYDFGILMSNVHNAWMRCVCGRMKSDYAYSATIVYNNFPWPSPAPEQKAKIEETAQGILDARALYPESSLADLYDPLTMPPKLQKAHTANDRAVMQAYGFNIKDMSEADCVAALMKLYQELVDKQK